MQANLLLTQEKRVFTVSEVTRDIRNLLEDNFPDLWISGEISNLKQASSGHLYFTLKDETATLKAVMFRGALRNLQFQLADGLEVVLHGSISLYEPRGVYQIIVDSVEPMGLGSLQLAYQQLKDRLSKEGLFDEDRKKPLPLLPQKIGIITSPQGAVLHDMLKIIMSRFPKMAVQIYPVLVQGSGAKEEIAAGLVYFNDKKEVDVIIVGRGGGSLEDLWAFNEEMVVRAIAQSQIPTISAVGHETDTTLSDFAADVRAPTPTAAAQLVVPEKQELVNQIWEMEAQLKKALSTFLNQLKERVDYLKKRIHDPSRSIQDLKIKLDETTNRLIRAQRSYLREIRNQAYGLMKRLQSASPIAPLKRGYSLVFKEGIQPIGSVTQLFPDDVIDIEFADGRIKARVT